MVSERYPHTMRYTIYTLLDYTNTYPIPTFDAGQLLDLADVCERVGRQIRRRLAALGR